MTASLGQPLSPKDRQLLALLARGCTNAQIARDFRQSEASVKSHVQRLLVKLGARNRAHAAVLGVAGGHLLVRRDGAVMPRG